MFKVWQRRSDVGRVERSSCWRLLLELMYLVTYHEVRTGVWMKISTTTTTYLTCQPTTAPYATPHAFVLDSRLAGWPVRHVWFLETLTKVVRNFTHMPSDYHRIFRLYFWVSFCVWIDLLTIIWFISLLIKCTFIWHHSHVLSISDNRLTEIVCTFLASLPGALMNYMFIDWCEFHH